MTGRRHLELTSAVAAAVLAGWAALASASAPAERSGFVCAGFLSTSEVGTGPADGAAASKPASVRATGSCSAIVLFARFADDGPLTGPPDWAARLLDPAIPGSFSHFYDTMSFGKLNVQGDVASSVYTSRHAADHYLSDDPTQPGRYPDFCQEILAQADKDIDFSRYDSDGPDGVPASADDDGVVDLVAIVVDRTRPGLIVGQATGVGSLGNGADYVTDDARWNGVPATVSMRQGVLLQGSTFAEASGALSHEYGHVLGLPDLYDTEHLRTPGAGPEDDSAGIGNWGLMGWGALGWNGNDGPTGLCAWSRWRLGWTQDLEVRDPDGRFALEDVGLAGQILRIPLGKYAVYMLEYRRRTSSYYDRAIPAEGLLVWHVEHLPPTGNGSLGWQVDLECADGRWGDAGYPLGNDPDPAQGGDNLDFWSHDQEYASRHAGNKGDRADPFDGVRYDAFTPGSDPSSTDNNGSHSICLDEIRIADGRVTGRLHQSPASVTVLSAAAMPERAPAGALVTVSFALQNTGGSVAYGLRAELYADDTELEILDPVYELEPLAVAGLTVGNATTRGSLRARFSPVLNHVRESELVLSIYVGAEPLHSEAFTVTGLPAHTVTCRVTGPEGVPVTGSRISWRPLRSVSTSAGGFKGSITSDSSGVARLQLPEGAYTLWVRPPSSRTPLGSASQSVEVDRDMDLAFSLPELYEVHGVVRDADGRPFGQASVSFSGQGWAETAADGSFTLRTTPGEHTVTVGQGAVSRPVATVSVPQDTVLVITLDTLPALELRVVDEEGVGIDEVSVYLEAPYPDGPWYGFHTTGPYGTTTAHIVPGLCEIIFQSVPPPYLEPDYRSKRVEVLADTAITIELTRGVKVSGTVVDEEGTRVDLGAGAFDASVRLRTHGSNESSYWTTCTQGEFSVAVPPDTYSVLLSTGVSSPPPQRLGTVVARVDTSVEFVARHGVAVSGRVDGIRGDRSRDDHLSFRSDTYQQAKLDALGAFSTRLVPGDYTVGAYFRSDRATARYQSLGTIHVTGDTVLALRLADDELVEGQVVDARGVGVPDVDVLAFRHPLDWHLSSSASTGDDGEFSMRLCTGTYMLQLYRRASGPNDWSGSYAGVEMTVPSLEPIVYRLPGGARIRPLVRGDGGQLVRSWLEFHASRFALREYVSRQVGSRSMSGETATLSAVVPETDTPGVEVTPGRYSVIAAHDNGWGGPLGPPTYERVLDDLLIVADTDLPVTLPWPWGDNLLEGRIGGGSIGASPEGYLYLYERNERLLVTVEAHSGEYLARLPTGVYEAVFLADPYEEYAAVYPLGFVSVDSDRTWDIDLADATAVTMSAAAAPERFSLEQSYPNPFNARTVIRYALPERTGVELSVYNLLGQRVAILASGLREAGVHTIQWGGRDRAGRQLASGVYLYRLQAGALVQTRRMLLLR